MNCTSHPANNMIRYDPTKVKGYHKERFESTKTMRLYSNEEFQHRQFIPKQAQTNQFIRNMKRNHSGLYEVKSKSKNKKKRKFNDNKLYTQISISVDKPMTADEIQKDIVKQIYSIKMKREPIPTENDEPTDDNIELDLSSSKENNT